MLTSSCSAWILSQDLLHIFHVAMPAWAQLTSRDVSRELHGQVAPVVFAPLHVVQHVLWAFIAVVPLLLAAIAQAGQCVHGLAVVAETCRS